MNFVRIRQMPLMLLQPISAHLLRAERVVLLLQNRVDLIEQLLAGDIRDTR